MINNTVCLVGDIVVDVTLQTHQDPLKMRLGGIVHAARGLWALGIPYAVAYYAPSYLDQHIQDYLFHHDCSQIIKIGNVSGAPNVFLIGEAKEIGDQGYDFLLRDQLSYEDNQEGLQQVVAANFNNHLIISGNYDLPSLVNALPNSVHIDAANNLKDISFFSKFVRKINTLFLSTSSDIFHNHFEIDFSVFAELFKDFTDVIILKENRGGSRGFHFASSQLFVAGAQPRNVAHSVGVGDVFDATFIGYLDKILDMEQRLVLSSWIAGEYASTTFPDDLRRNIQRVLNTEVQTLVAMKGIQLPWEKRKSINIYIAAPDFSFVDTRIINQTTAALAYHNFSPRRPVKENGEMVANDTKARKQELVSKDLELMDQCTIVLVILLYNDPGTLIELGYAAAKGIPAVLFDPYKKATNCMLTELPQIVSDDMDEIITEIFVIAANI